MKGIKVGNVFLDFTSCDFKCPHCKNKYLDIDDFYLDKINKSESFISKIECEFCDKHFLLTYNYLGELVSFTDKD